MKGRKAQFTFDTVQRTILLFVLIGMLLGAGSLALAGFRNNADSAKTGRVNNFTGLQNVGVVFSQADDISASCFAVTLDNSTNGDATSKFNVTGCTATLGDGFTIENNTNFEATYSSRVTNEARTDLNNSLIGITNLSEQLPTIGTLIGVGLMLAVVIGIFAFGILRKA